MLPDTPEAPQPGTQCEWWLLCDHEATRYEPHPILGRVPICERCTGKLRAIEGVPTDTPPRAGH